MRHFFAILKARNLELIRDHATWIWNIVFPMLLVLAIATLFNGEDSAIFQVGVVDDSSGQLADLKQIEHIQFVEYADLDVALQKLRHHQLDMVLQGGAAPGYWLNDTSPKGYLLEKVVAGVRQGANALTRNAVSGREIRYLDWVLPGVIGINLMHSGLFGVGYVIVRYRKNGVLKRLQATPLGAFEFLSAQVVSRLGMLLIVTVAQFAAMNLIFDFFTEGSCWLLLLIAALGAMAMISLGLLMASRTSSEELAGGLLNLLTWPMVFLSGVWFSLEGAPVVVQKLALIFPLTHTITAARNVMLDGAGFAQIAPEIAALCTMTLAFLLIASFRFKWGED